MTNDPIDYQRLRAQTEERLHPMLGLHQARTRLLVYWLGLVVYLGVNLILFQWRLPEILARLESDAVLTHYYETFLFGTMLFVLCLVGYSVRLFLGFRREAFIQRETFRELDLERLRLMAQFGHDADEKPKRSTQLGDDGELIEPEQIPNTARLRHVERSD